MEEKRDMYDIFRNRRPVSELTEDERQDQIEMCKRQLDFLYSAKSDNESTKLSKFEIETQIKSYENYLLELTRKERAKEIVDLLTTDPFLNGEGQEPSND